MPAVETDRLVIRAPMEDDRSRFVELFTDEAFTLGDGQRGLASSTMWEGSTMW